MNLFKTAKSRTWAAAAVSAAFLVPLGVFGAPALANTASASHQYSGSSQYQYKVVVCHRTHSKKHPSHQISVAPSALKAHLRHGDVAGPCPAAPPSAPKADDQGKSGDDHGKSGDDHGKSNDDHGNGKEKGKGK